MKKGFILIPLMAVALMAAGCGAKNSANNNQDSMVKESNTNQDSMMEPEAEAGVEVGGAMMVPSKDIVDNASNASNVTTLVAAVKAAGLVDTLKSDGPFTVFAPTNDAFGKLPAGTVDTLVKPESKATLTKILTYHVVPGRYLAKDLKDGMVLKTVQGQTLTIGNKNGQITVNGSAMVQTKDVISKNGVTFVIDSVLMPK